MSHANASSVSKNITDNENVLNEDDYILNTFPTSPSLVSSQLLLETNYEFSQLSPPITNHKKVGVSNNWTDNTSGFRSLFEDSNNDVKMNNTILNMSPGLVSTENVSTSDHPLSPSVISVNRKSETTTSGYGSLESSIIDTKKINMLNNTSIGKQFESYQFHKQPLCKDIVEEFFLSPPLLLKESQQNNNYKCVVSQSTPLENKNKKEICSDKMNSKYTDDTCILDELMDCGRNLAYDDSVNDEDLSPGMISGFKYDDNETVAKPEKTPVKSESYIVNSCEVDTNKSNKIYNGSKFNSQNISPVLNVKQRPPSQQLKLSKLVSAECLEVISEQELSLQPEEVCNVVKMLNTVNFCKQSVVQTEPIMTSYLESDCMQQVPCIKSDNISNFSNYNYEISCMPMYRFNLKDNDKSKLFLYPKSKQRKKKGIEDNNKYVHMEINNNISNKVHENNKSENVLPSVVPDIDLKSLYVGEGECLGDNTFISLITNDNIHTRLSIQDDVGLNDNDVNKPKVIKCNDLISSSSSKYNLNYNTLGKDESIGDKTLSSLMNNDDVIKDYHCDSNKSNVSIVPKVVQSFVDDLIEKIPVGSNNNMSKMFPCVPQIGATSNNGITQVYKPDESFNYLISYKESNTTQFTDDAIHSELFASQLNLLSFNEWNENSLLGDHKVQLSAPIKTDITAKLERSEKCHSIGDNTLITFMGNISTHNNFKSNLNTESKSNQYIVCQKKHNPCIVSMDDLTQIEVDDLKEECIVQVDIGGFQSSCEIKISLPEESLHVESKILESDVMMDNHKLENHSLTGKSDFIQHQVFTGGNIRKSVQRIFVEEALPANVKAGISGYQTIHGKGVQISDKSLKAAKRIFEEEEAVPDNGKADGFQTNHGKKVKISDESLKAARKTLEDDAKEKDIPLSFVGFQTGRGKKVQISDKSLKAAKKIFEEAAPNNGKADGFQT